MIARADPRPAEALDALVEFRVDADAQPGAWCPPWHGC